MTLVLKVSMEVASSIASKGPVAITYLEINMNYAHDHFG